MATSGKPADSAANGDDKTADKSAANPLAKAMAVKDRLGQRWSALRRRRPGIDHAVRGYQLYQLNGGDQRAAAITYFSFLALFPLVLLGVSIAGFVLINQPHLLASLSNSITDNIPGAFGTTLKQVINTAIDKRAGVGIVGVAGVALTGLGWVDNLRTAIDAVWGLPARSVSFVNKKLADALVLAGLGLGVVASIGLTVGGTAASGFVLSRLGLDHVTGAGTLARVISIALAIGGDMLIFGWLVIKMPAVSISRRVATRATLLAAVGFEILKVIGTFYIARITKSPAAGIFGATLGILVWIDLVARFLLFCVAWAAAGTVSPATEPVGVTAPAPQPVISPVAAAATLFAAGAAAGVGVTGALRRRWQQHRDW